MVQYCEIIKFDFEPETEGFCFYDTISGTICSFDGEQIFTSKDDFIFWYKDAGCDPKYHPLDRYTGKISKKYGGEVDYETN